jgi:hypothetical protein
MVAKGERTCFRTGPAEAKISAQRLLLEDFAMVVMSQEPVVGAKERLHEIVKRCRY